MNNKKPPYPLYTTTTLSTGGNIVYGTPPSSPSVYHVLGQDLEVSGAWDRVLASNIASLNILGKKFLEELHKNGFIFPPEIEEYVQKKFKILEREIKINSVIESSYTP